MGYYPPIGGSWASLGHTSFTVNSTATSLSQGGTYTIPVQTQRVRLQPETAPIRWRADGTDPTASVGNYIAALDVEEVGGTPSSIKVIRATGTNATLQCDFQGHKR